TGSKREVGERSDASAVYDGNRAAQRLDVDAVHNKVISGFQAFRQARAPVAGLEPATEGSLQISGRTRKPLCYRRLEENKEEEEEEEKEEEEEEEEEEEKEEEEEEEEKEEKEEQREEE
ncbi:hypothetical protein PoB_000964200, partial [Plakobranchus ocellatus]